jgi:hypothetical protein
MQRQAADALNCLFCKQESRSADNATKDSFQQTKLTLTPAMMVSMAESTGTSVALAGATVNRVVTAAAARTGSVPVGHRVLSDFRSVPQPRKLVGRSLADRQRATSSNHADEWCSCCLQPKIDVLADAHWSRPVDQQTRERASRLYQATRTLGHMLLAMLYPHASASANVGDAAELQPHIVPP